MRVRWVAMGAALSGGACWVLQMFVMIPPLEWAGLVILAVALVAVGTTLVTGGVLWLRLVAGVGLAALGGSVFELVRGLAGDDYLVRGVAGGVATGLVAVSVLRGRPQSSD